MGKYRKFEGRNAIFGCWWAMLLCARQGCCASWAQCLRHASWSEPAIPHPRYQQIDSSPSLHMAPVVLDHGHAPSLWSPRAVRQSLLAWALWWGSMGSGCGKGHLPYTVTWSECGLLWVVDAFTPLPWNNSPLSWMLLVFYSRIQIIFPLLGCSELWARDNVNYVNHQDCEKPKKN